MFRYVVAVIAIIASLQVAKPQDNVSATLARAERLYYEARFSEAIDLLLPVDAALHSQEEPGDKIKVKLQLALAYIGLSDESAARDRFTEIVDLDPGYALDPRRYSEKVLGLFNEVKEERNRNRCRTICMEGDRLLEINDAPALLTQIQSAGSDCVCLQATALDAAEHFYQLGLEAYKQQDYTNALENFRFALSFQPEHNLASSYIQLTLDKLRFAADQLFVEWRQNFDARQFAIAAAAFHRLQLANIEDNAKNQLNQAARVYRESVSRIVDDWRQACASGNDLGMANARTRATDMLPDAAVASDLIDQMQTCNSPKCIEMTNRVAMSRLKTRVAPEIPASFITRSVSVQVQARIDEKGNVTVKEVRGGNAVIQNAVKAAVERWKFTPAIVDEQVRCVETEIPIVINR